MTDTNNLAQALATLQTRLPEIKKDQEAKVVSQKGSYSYTYADLAQITRVLMPILGELGLSFIAKPTTKDDGRMVLAYKLLHISGQSEDGEYPLPNSGTPQSMGSAITYARRYCLCAVTGIAPEDDDDGAAIAQAEAERNQQRGQSSGQRSEWRAPAANPSQQVSNGDGDVTKPQLQKIAVLYDKADWTDRADKLRATTAIVGRPLNSSTELTRKEASTLIDTLEKVAKDPDPSMRLKDLVGASALAT